jgi:hypothetical protein
MPDATSKTANAMPAALRPMTQRAPTDQATLTANQPQIHTKGVVLSVGDELVAHGPAVSDRPTTPIVWSSNHA